MPGRRGSGEREAGNLIIMRHVEFVPFLVMSAARRTRYNCSTGRAEKCTVHCTSVHRGVSQHSDPCRVKSPVTGHHPSSSAFSSEPPHHCTHIRGWLLTHWVSDNFNTPIIEQHFYFWNMLNFTSNDLLGILLVQHTIQRQLALKSLFLIHLSCCLQIFNI